MYTGALEWGYQYGETIISPIVLVFTLGMGLLLLIVPRRYVSIPIFTIGFLITSLQRVVLFGFDLTMLRIVLLFGIVRIFVRKPVERLSLNELDVIIIFYFVAKCMSRTLLLKTFAAFVGALGDSYDFLGVYFILRCYLERSDDVIILLRQLCIMTAIIGSSMILENLSGKNMFAIFGGIPIDTIVRDGRLRSQGAFMHSILAGSFGATLLPLFAGLYLYSEPKKNIALIGMLCCIAIAITSSSSGPIIALVAGIMALSLWPIRKKVGLLMTGVVFLLLLYSVAKNAPFYRIITKFAVFGGSSSWHRYDLIDNFVRRLPEWWLFGTTNTLHWGWMMQDLANQYVRTGVSGGLVTLFLFTGIIAIGFSRIARMLNDPLMPRREQILVWSIGCCLFSHSVAFLDISYDAQLFVSWSILLAIIAMGIFRQDSREMIAGKGQILPILSQH